jgi:hypothetical protein
MYQPWITFLLLALLSLAHPALGQGVEDERFRDRIEAMRVKARQLAKEAEEVAKQGHVEQAERLQLESRELQRNAERLAVPSPSRDKHAPQPAEVQRLQERLRDLQAKGNALRKARAADEELAPVEAELAEISRRLQSLEPLPPPGPWQLPEFRARQEKLEVASRRLQHLRMAAELLKMAEAHDVAMEVMKRVAGLERELHVAKQQLDAQGQLAQHQPPLSRTTPPPPHQPDWLRELAKLSEEVHQLRDRLDKP